MHIYIKFIINESFALLLHVLFSSFRLEFALQCNRISLSGLLFLEIKNVGLG